MKNKMILLLAVALFSAGMAKAQGNWDITTPTASNANISSAAKMAVTGSFEWVSNVPFNNDNHLATLNFALPNSLYPSTGVPTLVYASNNTPVTGATFSIHGSGWKCDFAPGTSFAPGTKLIFAISNLEIKDNQSYSDELVSHFISFIGSPGGESVADNSSSITFSTTINSPLPVGLLSFDAKLVQNSEQPKVALNWVTVEEVNASHFIIQRSQNATFWVDVISVNAKGGAATKTKYESFDDNPIIGKSYYRLKQVDNNNDHTYSLVRVVDINSDEKFDIFPNPGKDIVNVQLVTDEEAEIEIKLKSIDGRVVLGQSLKTQAGTNLIQMDVREIAIGVYDLNVYKNGSLLNSNKFLKN